MKEFKNKALDLLEDIEDNGLLTDDARERYCKLVEETFASLKHPYDLSEAYEMQIFIEIIQLIRRHCI